MGKSVFNLSEELNISDKKFNDRTVEINCFISSCLFVFVLWMFNIITFIQFMLLNIFYIFWIVCEHTNFDKVSTVTVYVKKKWNVLMDMIDNKKIE
tara:strand:- start:228 stop:515 length:288 start_codon:yes stop_codon:yes gene_type:complete